MDSREFTNDVSGQHPTFESIEREEIIDLNALMDELRKAIMNHEMDGIALGDDEAETIYLVKRSDVARYLGDCVGIGESVVRVAVHFAVGKHPTLACGWRMNFGSATLTSTRGTRLVSCGNCRRTEVYKKALLEA